MSGTRRGRSASLPAAVRRGAVVLLVLLSAGIARAVDLPHGALTRLCQDCHTLHGAPGMGLTNYAGNANLCMTCHSTQTNPILNNWSTANQAVPGTSGTSHRWDALALNSTYGAGLPSNPEVLRRLDGWTSDSPNKKITCSACHNQHAQIETPFDPTAPAGSGTAGRHYMRIDNTGNALCLDCHSAWNIASVKNGTWTGNDLSHPVTVTLPTANTSFNAPPLDACATPPCTAPQASAVFGTASGGSTTSLTDSSQSWGTDAIKNLYVRFTSGANKNVVKQITSNNGNTLNWSGAITAITNGVTYEVDADGNFTNNLVFDDTGTPSYTAGKVVCMSCHAPHFADANSSTYDEVPTTCNGADCGKLLRRTNDDGACTGCHKLKIHNSDSMGNKYGTWGLTFTCRTCHTPHRTPNIYVIKTVIATPSSGNKNVDFRFTSGKADYSFGTATTPGNGICEVCHTQTTHKDGVSPRYRNTGGSNGNGDPNSGQGHYSSTCTACHVHSDGFKPGDTESRGGNPCSGCHSFGMVVGEGGATNRYHHVLESTNPPPSPLNPTPTVSTGDDDKRCVQCHADHSVWRPDLNAKNTLGRGANMRSNIATEPISEDPGESGASPGYYWNKDYESSFTNKGMCLSCHTNQQTKNTTDQKSNAGDTTTPAINATDFGASPHVYGVQGTIATGSGAFTVVCTKCHSSPPAETLFQSTGGTPAEKVSTAFLYFKPNAEPKKANELIEPMPNQTYTGCDGTCDTYSDAAGSWIGRSMSPGTPTAAYESTSEGWSSNKSGVQRWRMVTFTSPPVSTAATVPIGTWRIKINDGITGSGSGTVAKVRYMIYAWTTGDARGPTIVATGTYATQIGVQPAPGNEQTISLPSVPAVALAVGEKLVVDLALETNPGNRNTTVSYYFGNDSGASRGSLEMPAAVEFELTPPVAGTNPTFMLHASDNRRLLAPLGITSPGDPLGPNFCYRCHSKTSDTTPGGGPAKDTAGRDYYGAADMSGPSEGIFAAASKTFAHPFGSGAASHQPIEGGSSGWIPSGSRHAQCEDCHNPHAALPTGSYEGSVSSFSAGTPDTLTASGTPGWTAGIWRGYAVKMTSGAQAGATSAIWGNGANTLSVKLPGAAAANDTFTIVNMGVADTGNQSRPLKDVWGVQPTWPTPASAPDWNDTGTQPVAEDPAQFSPTVSTWNRTDSTTTIGEVCLKCHSAYGYAASPPNSPSGAGTSSGSAWSDAAGSAVAQSDLANTFNPNNLSHHAVFVRGKNQPIRANFGQSGITSYYNLGGSPVTTPWPRYTTASDSVTISSGSATFGGSAALPATALPGWYIYVGSDTASASVAGTGTTGYLEITSIAGATSFTVRAENGSGGYTTAINVSATANWFVTAGLGNNFVPPYGPWSVIKCSDCHTADATTDPLGPHGSGTKWLLRKAEAKTFLSFEGATPAVTTITTSPGEAHQFCQNCHRRDVYGDPTLTAPPNAFFSRQPHPVDRSTANALTALTTWGISCMNCHGGARIGGIHGSNLGKGKGGVAGSNYSGRRLLNGATWAAVKRSTTTTAGACWTKGTTDAVTNCSQSHSNTGFGGANSGKATYDFDSTAP